MDNLQVWSTLAAAVIAFLGLGGVIFALQRSRRQQRIEVGPYIRVDVGPTSGVTSDFEAPKPYFVGDAEVSDLAPHVGNDQKVILAAWLTNYQPNPLGIAFRVASFFILEARVPGAQAPIYRYVIVRVAYVEHGKPVKIELFKIPADWTATLWLNKLAFSDFYDEYHEHSEGRNENALHGRLTCTYDDGVFYCIPEARPAGPWPIRRLV